jgi:hypothetical protein
MHVDRAKFLVLTAAIATACGARRSEPAQVAGSGPDFDTTQGSVPGPASASVAQIATGEPVPPPTQESVAPAPTIESAPVEPPAPVVVVPDEPVDPRIAKICDGLRAPGPTCESFTSAVESCRRYARVMESRAAEAAAGCLAKRSNSARICELDADSRCASEGLGRAALAPGAAQSCTNILAVCTRDGRRGRDLTQKTCRAALSGYKLSVQRSLVECITARCEVGSCFRQVHE